MKLNLGKVLAENNLLIGTGFDEATGKQKGFLKFKLEEAGFKIEWSEINELELTTIQASKLIDFVISGLLTPEVI